MATREASAVFTIMVGDLPQVTAKIKGLLRENESLHAEVPGDAATRARQLADAYVNRH